MTKYSFEFYPPKTTAQKEQLDRTLAKLKPYKPKFVSVTFGAGGSTLSYTPEIIQHLRQKHKLDAAPHVSCVGGTRDEILNLLKQYRDLGCTKLVALRGDLPSGMGRPGELHYASDLVNLIREAHGKHFEIYVACYPEAHPQSRDALQDIRHFKTKMDAGADAAITQYFFNVDAYFRFVELARKHGIQQQIIPGIMPISNFSQLCRFSDMCGAEIPRWLVKRMHAYGDDSDSIRAIGADLVASICERLIAGGVPEIHFYTLNLSKPTLSVLERLK